MLAGDFTGLKLNDARESELGASTRRAHPRGYPVHLDRVREAHHHFFDDAIGAESLRQGGELEIRRDVRQKFIGVELVDGGSTDAGRDKKYVWVFGHRRERRLRVFEYEFGVGMLLPGGQHGLLIGREIGFVDHVGHFSSPFGRAARTRRSVRRELRLRKRRTTGREDSCCLELDQATSFVSGTPWTRRTQRDKWLWSAKPVRAAISANPNRPSRTSSVARCTRRYTT